MRHPLAEKIFQMLHSGEDVYARYRRDMAATRVLGLERDAAMEGGWSVMVISDDGSPAWISIELLDEVGTSAQIVYSMLQRGWLGKRVAWNEDSVGAAIARRAVSRERDPQNHVDHPELDRGVVSRYVEGLWSGANYVDPEDAR